MLLDSAIRVRDPLLSDMGIVDWFCVLEPLDWFCVLERTYAGDSASLLWIVNRSPWADSQQIG